MENVPFVPATFVCGTNVCALSTSETVSVPPVLSGALVSDSATVADDRTAASFVPLIVTCTVVVTINGTNRSEEHTSELQSRPHLVCRLLLEKKKKNKI